VRGLLVFCDKRRALQGTFPRMGSCNLQIVVWLSIVHLCLSYYEQPQPYRLVPQAAPQYYPQPQPQPYAMYNNPNYPASNYAPEPEYGNYYPQPREGPYPDEFLESRELDKQTPTGTDSAASSTGPSVVTPQETASNTNTPTDPPSTTASAANSNMDALDIQLAAALEAVKADMISKGKQVLEEKQWTDDVKAVIEQYQKKISNVYTNIEKLKVDMGNLYKKKQQIINAQIQKSLTEKLKGAKSDLDTVQSALDKVTNTEAEFEQSKKDIQGTIDSIMTQLTELKGTATTTEGTAGAAAEGETEAAAAGGSEAAATPADTTSDDTSGDVSDQDIVDKKAEISSKIDTIKSIVDALNSP